MGRLFDIDGPFMSGLSRFADIIILNILYLICCIPVFTIGAATTALYYVTLKMVRNEDCYTVKSFFKSFKLNFKQATCIWLIFLFAIIAIVTDFRIINGGITTQAGLSVSISKAIVVMLFVSCIVLTFVLSYVFPILSKFDNTIKNTIKNAFLMSMKHLPSTVAIVVINLVPWVLIYLLPSLTIILIISFALSAYGCSFLFNKIFKLYMVEKEVVADENFSINSDEGSFLFKKEDNLESTDNIESN